MSNQRGEGRARRGIINEAANLVASGMSESDVQRHIQEAHGKAKSTAERYLSVVRAEQARRISKARSVLVARQSAKLDNAQRKALSRTKTMLRKSGERVDLPSPDVQGFVAAVVAQNRLLGLNAPQQVEVLARNVDTMLDSIVGIFFDFVVDEASRRSILDRIQEVVTSSLNAKSDPIGDMARNRYGSRNLN